MKKFLFLIVCLCLLSSHAIAASPDGRVTQGPFVRPFMTIGRGLGNLIGSPFEITSTMVREWRMHSRLWPITYVPRFVTNILYRVTSGFNDIVFYPWYAPYTNDLSPLTESFGLPTYPWQIE